MPDNNTGGEPQDNGNPGTEGGTPPVTWESIVEGFSDEQRGLYDAHTQGLRSALDGERKSARDFERQLRDATKQLEEGSDLRAKFEELTAQLDEAGRRADFMSEASKQGVVNARLAWLAARDGELFDRRGNADWETLREQCPELFGSQQPPQRPPGNAGAGTSTPPAAGDMNTAIRRAFGR